MNKFNDLKQFVTKKSKQAIATALLTGTLLTGTGCALFNNNETTTLPTPETTINPDDHIPGKIAPFEEKYENMDFETMSDSEYANLYLEDFFTRFHIARSSYEQLNKIREAYPELDIDINRISFQKLDNQVIKFDTIKETYKGVTKVYHDKYKLQTDINISGLDSEPYMITTTVFVSPEITEQLQNVFGDISELNLTTDILSNLNAQQSETLVNLCDELYNLYYMESCKMDPKYDSQNHALITKESMEK